MSRPLKSSVSRNVSWVVSLRWFQDGTNTTRAIRVLAKSRQEAVNKAAAYVGLTNGFFMIHGVSRSP